MFDLMPAWAWLMTLAVVCFAVLVVICLDTDTGDHDDYEF